MHLPQGETLGPSTSRCDGTCPQNSTSPQADLQADRDRCVHRCGIGAMDRRRNLGCRLQSKGYLVILAAAWASEEAARKSLCVSESRRRDHDTSNFEVARNGERTRVAY